MKVLVINCGSSSLKYQLIDSETEVALAVGLCERIGIDGRLNHTPNGGEKVVIEQAMPDHEVAIRMVLDALTNENYGVIKNLDEIDAIGHRLVHGGEKFTKSVIIDDEVIAGVEECSPLAPLHNPANLIGVRACQAIMPGVPNIGVRHHRPLARPDPRRGRLRRRSAGEDRPRTGGRPRHHRRARHAQRPGEEGRHHGVLLCGRPVRRVHSGLRRQEHDRRGQQRLPEDRKA